MRDLVLLLVVVTATGCSTPPALGPSTTAPVPATTASVPTTTTAPGPVEIPARAIIWEPGTYTTNRFLVPTTFVVDVSGWRSYPPHDEWIEVGYAEEGGNTIAATLVIAAYQPTESVEPLLAAITSIEGVSVLSGPTAAEVAGFGAMAVDVEGAPDPNAAGDGVIVECSEPGGSGRFYEFSAGYQFFNKASEAVGIPACFRSRVWLVDVDGTTLTMIATSDDPDDFDRLMPEVEHLIDGLQFHPVG